MALRVLCERYGTYAQNQLHYREYVFLHFFSRFFICFCFVSIFASAELNQPQREFSAFNLQISTYPSAILPESSGLLFRIIWLAFPNLSACLFESSGLFKRTLNEPCPLLPRTYPVATPYLLRTFRLVCICFKTILQLSKKLSIVKYQL